MVRVKIPATSANVGPGFDCLGVALNLYNTFIIEEINTGLQIEGCDEKYRNENNLVYISIKKCFEKVGYNPKGIKIKMQCDIPESRGLGSSAACILGGVVGANEIAGGKLEKKEILDIATEIEGHPDNLAPALYGGMTVSIRDKKNTYVEKITLDKNIKFCALIPDFKLSTEKSRSVLPKDISYNDGVFNVGRTALLISALSSGNLDLIKIGCEDRFHQQYRGKLIGDYYNITEKCIELGSKGVFLSGAGPTIMNILHKDDNEFIKNITKYLQYLEKKWNAKQLNIDNVGVVIEN
ncbi:homoserine kinase [Haloimpatiens sp. FM7330]|uniref:homoserine kinase n=1 Tax=Haloimpatiens sp. FM7330 TaxID=3298610 RepID=UPI00362E9005